MCLESEILLENVKGRSIMSSVDKYTNVLDDIEAKKDPESPSDK